MSLVKLIRVGEWQVDLKRYNILVRSPRSPRGFASRFAALIAGE